MYTTEPIETRVYLRCCDGSITIYESYDKFLEIESSNYIYFHDRIINDLKKWKHHDWIKKFSFDDYSLLQVYDVYILTDPSCGYTYDCNKVHNDLKETAFKRYKISYYLLWTKHQYEFRKDPVPGTSGSRRGCSGYRTPRIIQEKRMSCYHGRLVRGRRNKANLPDPWDDIRRSDTYIKKSWKKQKKRKQWMKN